MNEYPQYETAAADPEPDPRVVAMQRVVDLEKQYEGAVREAENRQKRAAIVREELSVARDELNGLLGLPSRSAKAMDSETAQTISARRYQ